MREALTQFLILGAQEAPPAWMEVYASFFEPALAWTADNLALLAAAAGICVVAGELPHYLLQRRLKARERLASLYEARTRKWGIFGYLPYLRMKWRQRGGAQAGPPGEAPAKDARKTRRGGGLAGLFGGLKKKTGGQDRSGAAASAGGGPRCASCNGQLDDVSDYAETFDFERCPHCRTIIEPRFTPRDFVNLQIERLKAAADQGPKRRKRGGEDLDQSPAMSQMVFAMYAMSLQKRATDIHIAREAAGASVRFRVDGVLIDAFHVPPSVAPAFLSSIKVQANLDITNHTTPQDGRYNCEVLGVDFDVRLNCAPTSEGGEILFMRLLDRRNIEIAPAAMGFEGAALEAFEQSIQKPHGLVLVTGPTGSGKSTTLYVAMNRINTGERNIVTIEDPVEYQIPGLRQMQVNPGKGFTFATGLRTILRQDPDVILVGEIRDQETATMAIDAAVTGHLVFSTLHTMDTASAITRLKDLGVASKRYAAALELVLAQRLIRIVCSECAESYEPSEEELQQLGIKRIGGQTRFMRGVGCDHCNQTGFYGRRALIECMQPSEAMRTLLETETQTSTLRSEARKMGMRLLREEGVRKAAAGETTLQEVLRQTS